MQPQQEAEQAPTCHRCRETSLRCGRIRGRGWHQMPGWASPRPSCSAGGSSESRVLMSIVLGGDGGVDPPTPVPRSPLVYTRPFSASHLDGPVRQACTCSCVVPCHQHGMIGAPGVTGTRSTIDAAYNPVRRQLISWCWWWDVNTLQSHFPFFATPSRGLCGWGWRPCCNSCQFILLQSFISHLQSPGSCCLPTYS